jgi:succinate dehydrogenase / fumarate reductase cytochrome b subunit
MAQRPLSPHLGIYRFAYTMAMSILHRATGVALGAGLLLLVAFFASLASGPDAYAGYAALAASIPARVVFALLILAFLFHLGNGIRHLLWDASIGIERAQARSSWKVVVAFVVFGGGALVYLLLFRDTP